MVVASKFHRNAIITGSVDAFCLACDCYLKCEDDAATHIGKPVHRKNLDAVLYLEKYEDDCIRKIKKGYFCEFCNLLLATTTRVKLHVSEPSHMDNRGQQLLKRVGNTVLAFKSIIINECSWHGLIENTCVVCNTEFDNEDIHKNEREHVLNLVQNKVQFDVENNIFRKVDDTSFHCLSCNAVLAADGATNHFNSADHKTLYDKCRESNSERAKVHNDTDLKPPPNNEVITKNDDNQVKAEKPAVKNKTEPLDTQRHVSDGSPIVHKEENVHETLAEALAAKKSTGKSALQQNEFYCKALGAKNYIIDENNGKSCILCGWKFSSNWEASQHTNNEHHNALLNMHLERLKKMIIDDTKVSPDVKEDSKYAPKEQVKSDNDKNKILDAIPEFQKNRVKVDLISESAFCNICLKDVEFNYNTIENHIEEHKRKLNKQPVTDDQRKAKITSTKLFSKPVHINRNDLKPANTRSSSASSQVSRDEDIEEFARQNGFTVNHFKNYVLCNICDIQISLSLGSMQQHIAGAKHKDKLLKPKNNTKIRCVKKRMNEFINSIAQVQTSLSSDVIINDDICISSQSFLLYEICVGKVFCFVCESFFSDNDYLNHRMTNEHRQKFEGVLVLMNIESEFIRVIHSDGLHCGYCNMATEGMEDLEAHLQSVRHQECKRAGQWRLQMHLPDIRQNRQPRSLTNIMKILNM